MKSEETTILNETMANENEETQVMNQEAQPTDETTVVDAQQPTKGNGRISWKQVAIGGVSGILMGAASTLMMGATMPDKENTENGEGEADDPIAPTPVSPDTYTTVEGLPVATVSDEMSFGEAFAAARAEVGAGGVFEWHGNVYNTYYADEWNAMTPEQQAEFGERINYGGPTAQAQGAAETSGHTTHNAGTTTTAQETSHTGETEEVVDVDIQVLGVESVTFDDGSEGNVAVVEMGGQNVFLVDSNNDDVFEGAFSDLNSDGIISENEVADVSAAGMTVSDLQEQMAMQQDPEAFMAHMPDYTNDADTSAFYDA